MGLVVDICEIANTWVHIVNEIGQYLLSINSVVDAVNQFALCWNARMALG